MPSSAAVRALRGNALLASQPHQDQPDLLFGRLMFAGLEFDAPDQLAPIHFELAVVCFPIYNIMGYSKENVMLAYMALSTFLTYTPTASQIETRQIAMDITHADFCYYVEIFSQQVVRNKLRNIPFSRLNEFNYFNSPYSKFLEETATSIYLRNDVREISIESISAEFRDLCERTL